MWLKINGDADHANVADAYGNVGSVLAPMGDYRSALTNYHKTLEMRRRIFQDEKHTGITGVLKCIRSAEEALSCGS